MNLTDTIKAVEGLATDMVELTVAPQTKGVRIAYDATMREINLVMADAVKAFSKDDFKLVSKAHFAALSKAMDEVKL